MTTGSDLSEIDSDRDIFKSRHESFWFTTIYGVNTRPWHRPGTQKIVTDNLITKQKITRYQTTLNSHGTNVRE